MANDLNIRIAQALNLEHRTVQDDAYEQFTNDDPYWGREAWVTILDGDETCAEVFPRDWQNNANYALNLMARTNAAFSELRYDAGAVSDFRWCGVINAHHPKQEIRQYSHTASVAICKAWLAWHDAQPAASADDANGGGER